MTISSLRKLSLDEDSLRELYSEILESPALRGQRWDITSPDVIEDIWLKIVRKMDTPDPFSLEKSNQNKKVMALYPVLEKIVNDNPDPLYEATKLAILGNSLDFMVADSALTIENSIKDRINAPLSKARFSEFKQQLQTSQNIIYFGDNAGEIVFDKLFIETISKFYQLEIVFVVRSVPTLNDATLTEAKSIGLDRLVTVVENGIDGPLPGTVLSRCSKAVNDFVRQSDLIISKGGGNFDTLDEERKHLKKKISFLLLSKCDPHFKNFGVDLYHPVLANFY
jgi:uncharacterized protein with ATP-grasp and redox domains